MAAIYYSPALRRQDRLLLALSGASAVLIPLIYGIARAYYGYTHFGPVAAYTWSLPWLGVAGLLFLAWLVLIALVARRVSYGILLYRNGLRLGAIEATTRHLPARLPPILTWEEISGIAVELIASAHDERPLHRAVLFLKGGRKISLAEARSGWDPFAGLLGPVRIENLPELITRIKSRLYPRLLPELRAAFCSGQALSFGPVIIHRQQLAFRGESLAATPWSNIRRVTVQAGNLVVELENSKSAQPALHFPVSKIPNLELLLKLIEEQPC